MLIVRHLLWLTNDVFTTQMHGNHAWVRLIPSDPTTPMRNTEVSGSCDDLGDMGSLQADVSERRGEVAGRVASFVDASRRTLKKKKGVSALQEQRPHAQEPQLLHQTFQQQQQYLQCNPFSSMPPASNSNPSPHTCSSSSQTSSCRLCRSGSSCMRRISSHTSICRRCICGRCGHNNTT